MGFWSMLGDIGGSFIGDPGLGDQLSGLFGDTGQAAGGAAAGAASNRFKQDAAQNAYDSNAIKNYEAQLAAAQQKLQGNTTLANQAVRGDTMVNAQDAAIHGLPAGVVVPNISGGLRPSLMGAPSKQAGAQLSKLALQQLMNGGMDQPKAVTLTPLQTPSTLENILGGTALVGSLGGPVLKDLFGTGGMLAGNGQNGQTANYGPADPDPYGLNG